MELRVEPDLRAAVEELGTMVHLRDVLTKAGLAHSVLNVSDYESGAPHTQGVQVTRVIDGGVALTLQDFPMTKRYNCTLRGLKLTWNGAKVAAQIEEGLRAKLPPIPRKPPPSRPPPASKPIVIAKPAEQAVRNNAPALRPVADVVSNSIARLRTEFPEGMMTSEEVRRSCCKLLSTAALPPTFIRRLVQTGQLVQLAGSNSRIYGVVPLGSSPQAAQARYEEIIYLRKMIQEEERKQSKIKTLTASLESCDQEIAALGQRRADFALRLAEEHARGMTEERAREVNEQLAKLLKQPNKVVEPT